jgi:hypothetical protein
MYVMVKQTPPAQQYLRSLVSEKGESDKEHNDDHRKNVVART